MIGSKRAVLAVALTLAGCQSYIDAQGRTHLATGPLATQISQTPADPGHAYMPDAAILEGVQSFSAMFRQEGFAGVQTQVLGCRNSVQRHINADAILHCFAFDVAAFMVSVAHDRTHHTAPMASLDISSFRRRFALYQQALGVPPALRQQVEDSVFQRDCSYPGVARVMSEVNASSRFMLTREVVGKTLGFAAVTGEVVAIERWTETQVSTAGGSVHVHGNQVSVRPPKVWATAMGRKAIWLKTDTDELQIPVPEDLQVRQGHQVQAVIATGVDNGASQWAAIVNRDTNRWTQVDRFPPSGCYDPWTSVVMGFGQGVGNVATGIMCLYGVVLAGLFILLGHSWASLLWGGFIGLGVGFVHSLVGILQSKAAVTAYGAAVKAACDQVFAADA